MTPACSRSKITVERRLNIRRQRAAVPRRRFSEDEAAALDALLRGTIVDAGGTKRRLTVFEVQDEARARGFEISDSAIRRRDDRLGLQRPRNLPRAGMGKPGRKPGVKDSGPRKERPDSSRGLIVAWLVADAEQRGLQHPLDLAKLAREAKAGDMVDEIGISRQAIERHLKLIAGGDEHQKKA